MEIVFRYRGREISASDVAFIAKLIAEHPKARRRQLSILLCEAWSWRQANGALCDGVCRGLLLVLAMERGGPHPPASTPQPHGAEVAPTPAGRSRGGSATREPWRVRAGRDPSGPANARRSSGGLVHRRTPLPRLRKAGGRAPQIPGDAGGSPLACFCWSSAPRHLGPRDRYIGWSAEARKANVRYVAYQSRCLILVWVKMPHLASHLLGRMARQLTADWQNLYAHVIYFTETFVDPARFRGTCYPAANWSLLGMTTGRGSNAPTKRSNRPHGRWSTAIRWSRTLASAYRRSVSRGDQPQLVEVAVAAIQAMMGRAKEKLSGEDYVLLEGLVDSLLYVVELVRKGRATIARLRRLIGIDSTEKTAEVLGRLDDTKPSTASASPRPKTPEAEGAAGAMARRGPSRRPMGDSPPWTIRRPPACG